MPWIKDVQVENTPLTTTGGHTWAAAYRLADYFSVTATDLSLDTPGARILELGAGCGWLGATLARNLPEASLVCLSEQEEGGACDWLRHNVQLNRNNGLPLDTVRVEPCDWLRYADTKLLNELGIYTPSFVAKEETAITRKKELLQDLQQTHDVASLTRKDDGRIDLENIHWDFIIGSDLIYNQIGTTCLPRVMAALANPDTKIFYCHTKHRYDLLDMEFFNGLADVGLTYEEVWEPGEVPPPESPPLQFPPLDLFPEQRIAIFRIYKKERKSNVR